jgi:hypothetical protein
VASAAAPPAERGPVALGHDPAPADDRDPVGKRLSLVQIVGGEQDRGAVAGGQAAHQGPELAAGLRVEPSRRLVQEQQPRAADDADGDVEPAARAAGPGADPDLRLLRQADALDDVRGVARIRVLRPCAQ